MGGWTGEGKDTIIWDGTIKARAFVGGSTTTEVDPIFNAASGAYNTHIASDAIHYTQGDISITKSQVSDFGTYVETETDPVFTAASAAYNTHLASSAIHYTQDAISITKSQVSDFGTYVVTETDPVFTAASAAYNTHIASSAIHFTEASIAHGNIQDIGTNTHAAIDTHIASTAIHYTQASITSVGSSCAAQDHGTASSAMLVNVCYGTGNPPTASTTTEGTIYLKYTA